MNGNCNHQSILSQNIWDCDPELFAMITKERQNQKCCLEMIASENFTSLAVCQTLGSFLINKHSSRYYGTLDNMSTDEIEKLAMKRALELFGLDPLKWGVNVRPYSGSLANLAVYTGLLGPHGRLMGLEMGDGGHFSHGFFIEEKKISASSSFFESMPYKINPQSGLIDYDALERDAHLFRPKIIIAGMSCYTRCIDYKRFREICDKVGALLVADMAHIAGLVAARLLPSPFEYSQIVTTTSHKTLRGPRAGLIFFRKDVPGDFESKINEAVYPGIQGSAHFNQMGALATALLQAQSHEFVAYQRQILHNAQHLAKCLTKMGYELSTGGTDVHLCLIDLRGAGLSGDQAEKILGVVGIACNKNNVPGDTNSSGIRLGTPALTTRGLIEEDIEKVANFIHQALEVGKKIIKIYGKNFIDFQGDGGEYCDLFKQIYEIKKEVEIFAQKFPLPGPRNY